VYTIERDGQDDYEENPGKEFYMDKFSHKYFWIMFNSSLTVKNQLYIYLLQTY